MVGTFFRSENGTNWTESSIPAVSGMNDMDFDSGDPDVDTRLRIIARTADNALFTSVNGVDWLQRTIDPLASDVGQPTSVTYGNGLWVVGTSNGKIYTSINGNTWIKRDSPVSSRINEGDYGDGLFLLSVGSGSYLTSNNGIDWDETEVADSSSFSRATHAGDSFFLFGEHFDESFWRSPEIDSLTIITVTIPEHLDTLSITIGPSLNAEGIANSIRSAIIAANPINLTITPEGDSSIGTNIVEFESAINGDRADAEILIVLNGGTPINGTFAFVSVVVTGEDDAVNAVRDILNLSNIQTTDGRHNVSELSLSLAHEISGSDLRDAIISAFGTNISTQITGYTVTVGTVADTLIITSNTAGIESNLMVNITQAHDSDAVASNLVTTEGEELKTDGEITKLIYTIQAVDYTVTFPSGVPTANQQALFVRSTINTTRGNPITDGTDFVMSVNGSLLNFRVPEGTAFTDHAVSLDAPDPRNPIGNTDPYTGGTLVDAKTPVGTYVLPEIVSNVLSLTEFEDTTSTAAFKGVDFTEEKSVVTGKVQYTWNDYTTGGLFQELSTDAMGITVKLQFSKTDDGLTPAFVYRRIIGAGTANYSDIVYAEESLTTILSTRGG